MELFANENGEYVEFCDDVGMKARIDQYYPISKHDAFANSEVFKMNAIYRTIGSLYTTKVVQNWFAYLEKYYGIESPFAIREEIEATSIKTVSNGQRAQGDMVEWSIPPSGRSWNTALLASIEAFRVHYLSKSTASDITNVNEEHLYVLKHDRRYSSRNNAKVQRGKPSELLEFAPYHPIKLFVPKHLASTMVRVFSYVFMVLDFLLLTALNVVWCIEHVFPTFTRKCYSIGGYESSCDRHIENRKYRVISYSEYNRECLCCF